ncbi:hypothetical protein ACWELJ_00845 [Nocardia sp. NPDC004582]
MKFSPAIGYRWGERVGPDDLSDMLFRAAEADGGSDFMVIDSDIYSRTVDYAHAHGISHDIDEVKRRYGLA